MATLPSAAIMLFDNYSEKAEPSVLRTTMDRGYPVQRIVNTKMLTLVTCTLYFKTEQDEVNFFNWYKNTIGRVGFFDFVHPGNGNTIKNARFREGDIGEKSPTSSAWFSFMRSVKIEYLQ